MYLTGQLSWRLALFVYVNFFVIVVSIDLEGISVYLEIWFLSYTLFIKFVPNLTWF